MTQLDAHGRHIVAFIDRYWQIHHRSPSYEEIGEAVGLGSKDHVSRDLHKLKEMGLLTFTPGASRSIVLAKDSKRRRGGNGSVPLPVVGLLQPDNPDTLPVSEESPVDWISLGRELVQEDEDVFALRVQGTSMVDALVNDGDLVVLKRKHAAENGEMVAVWHKPTRTMGIKYYHRENGHVRLQPANPTLPAVIASPSDVEIRGQVLLIVRKAN